MGDKTYSYYDCPECGRKNGVEIYDHSSALMYIERCQFCDYKVDVDYYETEKNILELLTSKQAKEKGLMCKKCKSLCLNWADIKYYNSICWICREQKEIKCE